MRSFAALPVDLFRCPVCRRRDSEGEFELHDRTLHCGQGHQFDVARQGYVTLLGGGGSSLKSDTAAMLSARERALALPPYRQIRDAVCAGVAAAAPHARTVAEIGAGTGNYLAAVVAQFPDARGLGLDLSAAAAKRIVRAHPALGAVVADAWQPWPVAAGAFDVLLSVFSPRNVAESVRAMAPDGVLAVVTPRPEHLADLVAAAGMLGVGTSGDHKSDQVRRSLGDQFTQLSSQQVDATVALTPSEAVDVVMMGPSGFHLTEDVVAQRLCHHPTVPATVAVTVDIYRAARAT